MTKKNSVPIINGLEQAVSDVANAASVAATGSEIGVLELAVEDEINPRVVRKRKTKTVSSTKAATTKPGGLKRRSLARRSH
ncbi:MAG: hypothetical protein QOK01_2131 [Alphaproteobacteria bacterium]|nr:hypothetical protein [Alphaproteobacteria bacterium]